MIKISNTVMSLIVLCLAGKAVAADKAELAKQLSNPVGDVVNVPFQLNYDQKIGALENIDRYQLNIQPVIPLQLNDSWNLISRTILPVIYQTYDGIAKDDDWGTGDLTQSFFLSPIPKSADDWIWGVGPVMLFPTASEKLLGADQYGLGPTAVLVKQNKGLTFGALANHIWAVEHKDHVEGINNTLFQPFISYTLPSSTSIGLSSESTYDWNNEEAAIPVALTISKIIQIDKQLINVGAGVKYWIEDTDNSPKDFGIRLSASFIFPK